ncbi:MAG: hypothetical protein ACP6IT_07285, partial [Candidatus Thorarchaeota archaeon]
MPSSKLIKTGLQLTLIGLIAILILAGPGTQQWSGQLSSSQVERGPAVMAADYLLRYSASTTVTALAPGTVGGERGYAFVDDGADRLYFVMPLADTVVTVSLPSGTQYPDTIVGSDLDGDGETEFLVGTDNTTHRQVLEVDVGSESVLTYIVSVQTIDEILVGDFDGLGEPDIAVVDMSQSRRIITIDRATSTVIGTYLAAAEISCVDVGNYNTTPGDEISIGSGSQVTVISGAASVLASTVLPGSVPALITFQYGIGVEDIAVAQNGGNLTVLEGTTLNVIYARTFAPGTTADIFMKTANITLDGQIDLVVSQSDTDFVYFLDGFDGSTQYARQSGVHADTPFDVGLVDSDECDDVVILTDQDRVCFLHGSDGTIGYTETEIEAATRAYAYDIDADGRDDMLAVAGRDIYVRLSDTSSPYLDPLPVWPSHPTVADDYVKIEVGVVESSSVEVAQLHIRIAGQLGWPETRDLEPSASGDKYFNFLVGLPAHRYEYYIEIVDSYRNAAYVGGMDSPLSFEITGHLAWEQEITYPYNMRTENVMVEGNTSTGQMVFYTASMEPRAGGGFEVIIRQYHPNGTVLQSAAVPIGTDDDTQFALLSAKIDSDAVVDLELLTTNDTRSAVYHINGINLSFVTEIISQKIRDLSYVFVFDDNDDGLTEIHVVDGGGLRILRRGSDGTWTNTQITLVSELTGKSIQGSAWAQTGEDGSYQLVVTLNDTHVMMYDATNLSLMTEQTIQFESAYTDSTFATIAPFHNASIGRQQFIEILTIWRGSVPDTRLYFFDVQTTNISETGVHTISSYQYRSSYLYDLESDGIDELFMLSTDGMLSLMHLSGTLTVDWSIYLGDANPSGYVVTDFDGEDGPELVVFTHQDKTIRAVNLDGHITRTVSLARIVYNPVAVGAVDPGAGQDIAAFPILEPYHMYVGVVRDLDWYYRVNYTVDFSATDIVQGGSVSMNVTARNIYGEPLANATVTMTTRYSLGGQVTERTYGLVYNSATQKFGADVQVNWPMGLVNMSLSIADEYYHPVSGASVGQLVVRSPLTVAIHTVETAKQDGNMTIYVTVTDSLGLVISDATVNVSIDGTDYSASFHDPSYEVFIPSVTFAPGDYVANATVYHPFGTAISFDTTLFRVTTDTLVVSKSIPNVAEQEHRMIGWLNLTDSYSNAITGATVKIRSGGYEFTLSESSPGSYLLNDTASLPIGHYVFTILVQSDYVSSTEFGTVSIDVYGNLTASLTYPSTLEAGSQFNASAFVYDAYGTVPAGVSVHIEFGGANYTASSLGGAEFGAELEANTTVGTQQLVFYVEATYGHSLVESVSLEVFSG